MRKIIVNLKEKSTFGTTTWTGTITLYDGPRMPGLISLVLVKESGDMLQFKLVLPKPGASDVVSRELSVMVAEADPVIQTITPSEVEVAGFEGEDNAAVQVSLTDIDDAGNRSEARVQDFTLADTMAPPVPGDVNLVVTGET